MPETERNKFKKLKNIKMQFRYDARYYNLNSPKLVVPILLKLFNPKSVLDVGCGIGTWLKTFSELGVKKITGIDSSYVDTTLLSNYISPDDFIAADLSRPFDLNLKYDLIISLEVAEHLPEASADVFVDSLARHGDIIVFSAAVPHQGGQNHINEQWPTYWIEKFKNLGYNVYDIIRPRIWNLEAVEYWYRQNILVFSTSDFSHFATYENPIVNIVHPLLYNKMVDHIIYQEEYIKQLEQKLYSID